MAKTNSTSSPAQFSKRFLWGAASSAHQYEGGLENQWSVWEHNVATSLATRASYQYNDLDSWQWTGVQAKSRENYISGLANNHREHYETDFNILEMMNLNAWRFGVEWSRVETNEGVFDEEAINWYQTYISQLQDRNIEPIVTLFHFTIPRWFADMGGFEKRGNIDYFERYAKRMIDMLSSCKVRYVITVNEPDVYMAESYIVGDWPPNKRKFLRAVRVQHHLALAHKRISGYAHKRDRRLKVAIAKNSNYFKADDQRITTKICTKVMQYFQDDYFLRSYVRNSDFIGVNYYFSHRVSGIKIQNDNEKVSDLGWDLKPRDIQLVLERLAKKYKKPLFVTENGLADATDRYREWWLKETIIGMHAAMKNGVSLIGYLHWSLLDNFEWDKGFWPRFGLIEVDYKSMRRRPRKSAVWYAKTVKNLRGI